MDGLRKSLEVRLGQRLVHLALSFVNVWLFGVLLSLSLQERPLEKGGAAVVLVRVNGLRELIPVDGREGAARHDGVLSCAEDIRRKLVAMDGAVDGALRRSRRELTCHELIEVSSVKRYSFKVQVGNILEEVLGPQHGRLLSGEAVQAALPERRSLGLRENAVTG